MPCLLPDMITAAFFGADGDDDEVVVVVAALTKGRRLVIPLMTPNRFVSSVVRNAPGSASAKELFCERPALRARRLIWPASESVQ